MNATKQAAWLFLAVMCIACSSWYFASSPVIIKLDKHTLSTTIDMAINNLTVHQFNAEGQLVNYLQTPLMHHISENNTHLLKAPHIVVSQPNQPTLEIHSQQATALYGGQQITFNKNVVIHQSKNENTQESTLKTEAITYFSKDKIATTALDVTYERAGNIVKATGMKAYLAEKRVQLLSNARGSYEPSTG